MEALSLILFIAIFFLWYWFERKLKEKSERYQWILTEQDRFHIIAHDFENQCKKLIEQALPKHTEKICVNRRGSLSELSLMIMFSNNRKLIDELENLKNQFLREYPAKYESRYGTFYFEQYPQYILDNYHNEICQIASHYYYIAYLMRDQIAGMRPVPGIDME